MRLPVRLFPPVPPAPWAAAYRCKCLTLGRDAFERLMGPVEQSLAQQIAAYAQSNAEALAVAAAAAACGTADKSGAAAAPCQRAPTPPPTCACCVRGVSVPAHAGSAAALLPGSPRPRAHSSDQSSPGGYSWRRSRRGTGSEAGDSPGASQCSSPLASLLASQDAPRGAPEGVATGGEPAEGEGAEPLPTIAEETTLDAAGAAAAAAAAAEFAQERADAAAAAAGGRSGKAASRAAKPPVAPTAGRKLGVAMKKVAAAYKPKQAGK